MKIAFFMCIIGFSVKKYQFPPLSQSYKQTKQLSSFFKFSNFKNFLKTTDGMA